MAAPLGTFGTTLHTSASLGAAGTATDTLDLSTKFEGQLMHKITAGGTVAATYGLKIEVFMLYSGSTYGNASTGTVAPNFTYSATGWTAAQIVYAPMIFLPTGKYLVRLTNLDAANAITVESIYSTIDSVS